MDNINPNHYKKGNVECIEALEASTQNLKGIEAVCTANVIKYLWRWKEKNGVEDLRKAQWYLNRLMNCLEVISEENLKPNIKEDYIYIIRPKSPTFSNKVHKVWIKELTQFTILIESLDGGNTWDRKKVDSFNKEYEILEDLGKVDYRIMD